jgi:hypothetical protein
MGEHGDSTTAYLLVGFLLIAAFCLGAFTMYALLGCV